MTELIKAPEVSIKVVPAIVRKTFERLQGYIHKNRERLGENHPLVDSENQALAKFADGRYFMYPSEKGMVHCKLPGGLTLGVEAEDHEYEVVPPSVPSSNNG